MQTNHPASFQITVQVTSLLLPLHGVWIRKRFMEDWVEKGLSNLKFRLSYGSLGNNSVGNYDAIATYANKPSSGSAFNYTLNNALILGLAQAGLANPDLTWEFYLYDKCRFRFRFGQ